MSRETLASNHGYNLEAKADDEEHQPRPSEADLSQDRSDAGVPQVLLVGFGGVPGESLLESVPLGDPEKRPQDEARSRDVEGQPGDGEPLAESHFLSVASAAAESFADGRAA